MTISNVIQVSHYSVCAHCATLPVSAYCACACNRYWVVITGRYCTHSGSTEPALIELYDVNPYQLTLTLGSKDEPCNTWITKDPEAKAIDMEEGLLIPTSLCGYEIPCFEGSTWKCMEKDPMKVTFEYVTYIKVSLR